MALAGLLGPSGAGARPAALPLEPGRLERLEQVRVPFVENRGQFPEGIAFSAPTLFGAVTITRDGELVYWLPAAQEAASENGWRSSPASATLRESLVSGRPTPSAGSRAATRASYFIGRDRKGWQTGVPTFDEVLLGEVWPGVSVALRAHGGNVEKVFTVSPGSSPDRILLRLQGATRLRIDRGGALVAQTGIGEIRFTAPAAYQEREGSRRPVQAGYFLEEDRYGFRLGSYDRALPVVIDPLLQSTYLGGSGFDQIDAIAVHPASGEVFVAGHTTSQAFSKSGSVQPSPGGGIYDGFVARLGPQLKVLVQITFLGGAADDYINAIAVDPSGVVLVAGNTFSSDLPGTSGGAQPAIDPDSAGFTDGFVARFDATLETLSQATYVGGNSADTITSLAVDPGSDDVLVAGSTASTNLPRAAGGARPSSGGGLYDGWVGRLDPALTSLLQTTYLGGSADDDRVTGIAVHSSTGEVFVTGTTSSLNFPGVAGGARTVGHPGSSEGFVSRLNPGLSQLLQSTYLGGSNSDTPTCIAIDQVSGDVLVAGLTLSSDFPGTSLGAQPVFGGGAFTDGFVTRLNTGLKSLLISTFLGSSRADAINAIAIHSANREVLVGGWGSRLQRICIFPPRCTNSIVTYGLVARLSSNLGQLLQSTQLGANALLSPPHRVLALAVHPASGEILVAGFTSSTSLARAAGGAQSTYGGGVDGFVSRFTSDLGLLSPQALAVDASPSGGSDGNGILEPRETVFVSPAWQNTGSAIISETGTASALQGPPASYFMLDTVAVYGGFTGGATRSAANDPYRLSLLPAATRPTHFDAHFTETLTSKESHVWTLHLGESFSDVPRSHPFYRKIETLLHSGVTAGCFPATQYCPNEPVTRSQMTLFTGRALSGGGSAIPTSGSVAGAPYNCIAGGVSLFTDVAPEDVFCKHLHWLAAQKVTLACAATELCPSQNVHRDAMAGFIAEALVAPGGDEAVPLTYGPDPATGRSYSCDEGSPNLHFIDLPVSDPHCRHANYLWARGLIAGCSETAFCATADVTRDQMAKFLVNAFGLTLYGP
jgi:hypothetical protein